MTWKPKLFFAIAKNTLFLIFNQYIHNIIFKIMPPSIDILAATNRRIEEWKQRLIDLTRRNRLLYFQPSKSTSLALSCPESETIFDYLYRKEKTWRFWLPPLPKADAENTNTSASIHQTPENLFDIEASQEKEIPALPNPKSDELVCENLNRKQLDAQLKNLFRRAKTDYQERGVRILYVAFGTLIWNEGSVLGENISPLILCPVDLWRDSAADPYQLSWAEEDLILNPALVTKLRQDFRIELPEVTDDLETQSLKSYFERIEAKINQMGWRVENTTHLGLFSFHKLAIYQDLADNAKIIQENGIVRGLAGESIYKESLSPIPSPSEIDNIQKPPDTFQILDADSSQQQAIEASLRGHNLVLHGPPGTGKSQTIANIIAEFLAREKTVLFVSEKMAALEVVFKRLQEVHLDEFCLELHSHKANKREVIESLNQSLTTKLTPQKLPSREDFEKLQSVKQRLNDYVEALHKIREPLGLKVRDVLAKLAGLTGIPYVSLNCPNIENLSQAELSVREALIKQLKNVWTVVVEGRDFPWYGYREVTDDLTSRSRMEKILNDLLQNVINIRHVAAEYANAIGVEIPYNLEDTKWLLDIGVQLNKSPAPDAQWLVSDELITLSKEAEVYGKISTEYWQLRSFLLEIYHENYLEEATPASTRIQALWNDIVSQGIGVTDQSGASLLGFRNKAVSFLEHTIRFVRETQIDIDTILQTFGLLEGQSSVERASEVVQLATVLISLSESTNKPEVFWFKPHILGDIQTKMSRLRPQYEAYNLKKNNYHTRRKALLEKYDTAIFELNLNLLIENFSKFFYRSPLRFLLPAFYRDKRIMMGVSRTSVLSATLVEDLVEARELVRLAEELTNEKPNPVELFGRYDEAEDTDFGRLGSAIDLAKEIQHLTENAPPEKLLRFVEQGSAPSTIRQIVERLQKSITVWRSEYLELDGFLPAQLKTARTSFLETPFNILLEWAKISVGFLTSFRDGIDRHLAFRKNTENLNLLNLIEEIKQKETFQSWQTQMESESDRLRRKFGRRYAGFRTTWAEILEAIEWTNQMRKLFQEKFPNLEMSALFIEQCTKRGTETVPVGELQAGFQKATDSLNLLLKLFYSPTPLYNEKSLIDCTFPEMEQAAERLINRLDELKLWADYKRLSESLAKYDLADFVNELQKISIEPESILSAFHKSFYHVWLSRIYENESVIRDFRTATQEDLIKEFRETDRKLIKLSAQSIIERCDKKRPTSSFLSGTNSEEAILRREATKKRRHLPVRSLFRSLPNLLLRLKPCLMMSPLSVSQFLPSEQVCFDLVIFDEASQIFTEDAIGAIYRGSQFIVAGDNKQMPPTDFFRTTNFEGDEEESVTETPAGQVSSSADYSSVLDEVQAIDGISVQHLRWHYRSRHESLIAFSNNRFYNNKLVTFPSSQDESSMLGVKFLHVLNGVYDRGGKRDNKQEAEVVADKVFEHFSNHPEKSLGVVAFSQAQMTAIEDEIERRRIAHPEFEDHFKEDRLEGFFVKNLENVQGDERDVIFFSVGYGRDLHGNMTMNFGPLNRDGGERRLNVAVTRAREKVLLISSIKASDIAVSATASAGVLNFHRYLDYAERGLSALALNAPQGLGEAESPLEEDIAAEIKKLGFEITPQVGCSGYRIDMGVFDPAQPGKFLLGIEADGATYHSAYTARDRDRLRQQVLENLGWRIHRIWSPDWISQRQTEISRLKTALQEAKNHNGFFLSKDNIQEQKTVVDVVRQQREVLELSIPPEAINYKISEIKRGAYYGWDFHGRMSEYVQIDLLQQIVSIEGPLHIELAARRLLPGWFLEKVNERVIDTTRRIAKQCEKNQMIQIKGDFFWSIENLIKVADLRTFPVRVPFLENQETKRDIKFIASEEIQAAMLLILKHALSIELESLLAETRKLFGFSRSGENIKERLVKEFKALEKMNLVESLDGKFSFAK